MPDTHTASTNRNPQIPDAMTRFAFVDASNLFYGGEKSLGWRIDYEKLLMYLREKYSVSRTLYFGGVEIHGFEFDYLAQDSVPLDSLQRYLGEILRGRGPKLNEAALLLLSRHVDRVKFYKKLETFGYELHLKPVKQYAQEDGGIRRKANCDVEMTFHLMKEHTHVDGVVVLSGDGDFLPVLKHLKQHGKDVVIFARGSRTAREIRQFAGGNFRDFEYLKYRLQMLGEGKNTRGGLV